MSTTFKNKTIWITGAGSGIGKALAIAFADQGARIILSGRKLVPLENCKSQLVNPESHIIIQLDLADRKGIESLFSKHDQLIDQVDILVNNAGISQRSFAKDTDFDVYKKLMDVNYLGTVKLSLLILKKFLSQNKGRYVVISSVAGKIGVPVRSGYSASKFALHGFFEALRAELANTNININMICPGFIKTDISKNALTGSGTAQGTMDNAQANGMPVEKFAKIVMTSIRKNKAETIIGGFRETKLAVLVSRFFPNLLRKIIAKSKVT